MKADEAAELIDRQRETDTFRQRAAIVISVLAMMLAITGLGGQNAAKEAMNANVQASNLYGFFQAKNARQTSYVLAADVFEVAYAGDPTLPEAARQSLRAKADHYRATALRYESEPDTQEGKRELLQRAKAEDARRDHALKQDPYFDYAEVLLQIAIVLISVALVAEVTWLAIAGAGLGVFGTLLMLNGYTLLVELPLLS